MTESQCLLLAEQFLRSRGIGYLPSGKIGRKEENRMEAIFDIPQSNDPAVAVCDPPNVRVWVMPSQGFVELIHEM